MSNEQYAMLITKKNLRLITEMNSGVEPAPECLENPTYFVSPLDPEGHNELLARDEFLAKYELLQTESVFVITRK